MYAHTLLPVKVCIEAEFIFFLLSNSSQVQYIMAAGTFINTTDYKITFTGGIEEEFLEYTQLVNAQIDPPLVHSISYGEYGGSYDNATDQRFSYELEKVNTNSFN